MPLPDLHALAGEWHLYVDEIYQVYLDEIVNANLTFQGLKISCQYRPPTLGKHFGFWHVISEGNEEDDRLPDLHRCERIGWIAYLIENAESSDDICWWVNTRGRNKHVVIWHESENFVVILAKRKNYYLLKTAYCAKSNRVRQFIREKDEYWNNQKG